MNYKDIKNYIHNDLKISKEELRKAILDAIVITVNTEVRKCLNDQERLKGLVEGQVRYELMKNAPRRSYIHSTMDDIYNKIDEVIHEEVVKRLQITLKEPDDE